MLDKNKTALTHRITALAAAYLDNAGFKPVETEVTVYDSWIADVASFIYPTRTEVKKLKITEKPWGREFEPQYNELHYLYGFPLTAIVEVKISINDFKRDLDYKFSGHIWPAHLCYLAYPKGLLNPDEIPYGWIGLECSKNGGRLLKLHHTWRLRRYKNKLISHIHHPGPGQVTDLIANVAIRRDHRTRYVSLRAFSRSLHAENMERKKQHKLSNMINVIANWMMADNEESLKDALEKSMHIKLPFYLENDLKFIEKLKTSASSAISAVKEIKK
jgi:hypothetical protein